MAAGQWIVELWNGTSGEYDPTAPYPYTTVYGPVDDRKDALAQMKTLKQTTPTNKYRVHRTVS